MADLALVGRADELELARGLLRRATEGIPGVLLVGGEAGVGRSRLVAAVATTAGSRLVVSARSAPTTRWPASVSSRR